MERFDLKPEYYGELLPYLQDDEITDILWNGRHLWIKHLKKGKYIEDIKLSDEWIKLFAIRLSHLVNQNFNYSSPVLEAEIMGLRFSVIYPDVANQFYALAIRKIPVIRRLNEQQMLEENYANQTVLHLLEAFVVSNCSLIVIGEPGSGKTELIKYLTKFIPDYQRTATIEDKYELRLSKISPNLDVIELRVNDKTFTYRDAIITCLQQDVHNMILQEARGSEAYELLEAASTGCRIMTTFHCDDVTKVPDRIVNMIGVNGQMKKNDVYAFFDVVIKLNIHYDNQSVYRWIEQIGILDRYDEQNKLTVLYEHGKFDLNALTPKVKNKLAMSSFDLKRKKGEEGEKTFI